MIKALTIAAVMFAYILIALAIAQLCGFNDLGGEE